MSDETTHPSSSIGPRIEKYTAAISDLLGCEANHLHATEVFLEGGDCPIFEGEIDTFDLVNHPTADQAFAWSYCEDDGSIRYLALLKSAEIPSPADAVATAIKTGMF